MEIVALRHFITFKPIKCAIIFFTIASILICIACNILENNRFYFTTSSNGVSSLEAQYLTSSHALDIDFAEVETLRSANTSYTHSEFSVVRSHRTFQQSYLMLVALLWTSILVLSNPLRSFSYAFLPKQSFSSIRIAGFIEYSDGKK